MAGEGERLRGEQAGRRVGGDTDGPLAGIEGVVLEQVDQAGDGLADGVADGGAESDAEGDAAGGADRAEDGAEGAEEGGANDRALGDDEALGDVEDELVGDAGGERGEQVREQVF